MVDGRVARETNRVTRFGGFFDSVLDRYSDGAADGVVGLVRIDQPAFLCGADRAGDGSLGHDQLYPRTSGNSIPKCKVGFMERPERVVLLIIGALSTAWLPCCG